MFEPEYRVGFRALGKEIGLRSILKVIVPAVFKSLRINYEVEKNADEAEIELYPKLMSWAGRAWLFLSYLLFVVQRFDALPFPELKPKKRFLVSASLSLASCKVRARKVAPVWARSVKVYIGGITLLPSCMPS